MRRYNYLSLSALIVLLSSAGLSCGGGPSVYTEPTPATGASSPATHSPSTRGPATRSPATDTPAGNTPTGDNPATDVRAGDNPTAPGTPDAAAPRTAHPPQDRAGGRGDTGDDSGPVTIAFAGDIQFEGQIRPRLASPETALAPIRDELAA